MNLRTTGPGAVVLAFCVLTVACASTPRPSVLSHLAIRPAPSGAPAPDAGYGPVPDDSLETVTAKIRHLSSTARPRPKVSGVTIEGTDARLAAALMTLATVPGAASHRLVAEEYMRVGVLDAAHNHFRKALALNRRDAAAHDGLARIWRAWGLPGLGLGDAQRAVYFMPQSAAAHNTLGTILQALGSWKDARQAYSHALSLATEAPYALNNLCYLTLLEKRTEHALPLCLRAVHADPASVAARHNLALAYAAQGRMDLAERELARASPPTTAAYNLGIINLAQREPGKALVAFDRACRTEPRIAAACTRAEYLRGRRRGGAGQ
ncbi:MAG: tetratricopeptide repeat protein [Vicinamibacterales bacterium]